MIASADPVHPVAIRPDVGIQCVWVNIGKTVIGMNSSFPGEGEGWFMTVGGLLMHQLDRVPVASDYLDYAGYRFEVVDMDKNRVDKVLVTQTLAAAMNLE